MRKARYLLAATLLATALCADRAMAAAPTLRPEVVQLAERFVSRLSISFSRVVSGVRIFAERRHSEEFASVRSLPSTWVAPAHPQPILPFQFRLPPPTV